ncbi:ECF RNA polymerase sigma factor SigK [Mycolicibacterium sarraceniae]|uniref:ECF RNA polymerase sigma factor SigK n=2 Tax=Mycolicibacterium sarraceniae TaxID=1534348 RepID=A0A7I7SLS8_9MYCO|nr:ECF RNA polymerase sigma factor SigK [Mycolicibacterium sarraceniae]
MDARREMESTVATLDSGESGACLWLGYGLMNGSPPPRKELEALLARAARQDAEAFATFYDLTKARVYGLVLRILRDPGYSQETTQDIFLHVWRNATKYDPAAGSAMAWLMTVAHGRAVERVRSEEASRRREDRYGTATVERPGDDVAEAVLVGEDRRRVAECLGSLTDVQRECIELAYYGGLTYPEVSARLSANLSTIKSRIRDALRGLRNCLAVA